MCVVLCCLYGIRFEENILSTFDAQVSTLMYGIHETRTYGLLQRQYVIIKTKKTNPIYPTQFFFPDRGLIHIHNNNWQPIMCCTTIILYLCKRVYIILLLLWVAIRLYVFSIVNIIFYTIHDWCAPIQYNIYSILF